MTPKETFDHSGKCLSCGHDMGEHRASRGTDGAVRIYCASCPMPRTRVIGDEGVENAIPFFIEMSFGSPDPCFEERPLRRVRQNLVPRSPGDVGDSQMVLSATDETGTDTIRLTGTAWRVNETEGLKVGCDVEGSIVYKLQLYWDQEGLCPGCRGRFRFDNMEMDRVVPGADGGGYTVGNVQLLCSQCNRIKGERPMEYLLDRRGEQGLLGGLEQSNSAPSVDANPECSDC